MTKLQRKRWWRLAAAAVLLSSSMASQSVLAQDDDEEADVEEPKTLERKVVTGSRIARTQTEGPSPVFIISRDQIEREGFTTVEGALKSLSQATGIVQNEAQASTFTQNANSLDLRGLGPGRTLILVDGKRVSDYPLPYNGQSNIVNISAIPLAAVDRIEVLAGGASAIYGSDALAGVVNIILRNDLGNSVEVNLLRGTTKDGGLDSTRVQAVGGFLGEKWNITYALEYFDSDPLYARQRDYMDSTLDNPDPAGRINTRNAIELDALAGPNGLGPTYIDPGNCDGFAGTPVEYSSRADPVTGERFYCGTDSWVGEISLVNARERASAYLNGTFEVGDSSEIYASLNYFTLDAELDTQADFYSNLNLANNSIETVYIANSSGTSLAPFGVPGIYGFVQRLFTDAETGGANSDIYDEDVIDYSIGLRGDFFSPLWQYEVSYHRSEYDLDRDRTRLVVDNVNNYFFTSYDRSASDPFGFGVPVATLNYQNLFSALTPEIFASLTDTVSDTADSSTETFQFTVNGDLIDLPAGPLGVAFVAESSSQDYDINLDPRLVTGTYFWGLTGSGGGGDRDRTAAGIEMAAPITSWLTLTGAGRYDKYDDITNVDDATTYRFGVEIRPHPKVLVRGSYATGFRAPDMHYVFAAPSGFFTTVTDLFLCERDEPTVPLQGCTFATEGIAGARQGNPLLEEEESETLTFGIVVEPTEDLYFSVDFYDIELDSLVVDNPLARILELEADCRLGRRDPNSGECIDVFSRIIRNPADGGFLSERLISVNTGPVNAAKLTTEGVDATLQYRYETARFGDFSLNATWSHVLDTKFKVFPEDELLDIRTEGTRDWRSRVRGNITWRYKDFRTTLFGERFGSALSRANVLGAPGRDLGPLMTYSLSVASDITDNATVSVHVNNLFDRGPQSDDTHTTWPYFDFFNYGQFVVGREIYGQFSYRFDY